MSLIRKFLWGLVIVFVAIQFIQPARNGDTRIVDTDMIHHLQMPDTLATIFRSACYDCHSNNTRYPWYANVQPFGWLLSTHVKEGKAGLNFAEFGNYSSRRQVSKLKGIYNSIKDGSMPLKSYVFLHPDAKLTAKSKASIMTWTIKTADSLAAKRKIS